MLQRVIFQFVRAIFFFLSLPQKIKCMNISCVTRSLSLCNIMHWHVKRRFPVLILFTQPSAVSVTAAK